MQHALGIEERAPPIQRRVADALVDIMLAHGVDTFFGIPGGPASPIFDAVLQNPRARLIESRHETSAAFAAAGYYRATGAVPCVIVTAGPGASNVVTGVASAHFERVPMIVICGDVPWATKGERLVQDSGPEGLDVENIFRSITRAQIRIRRAESANAFVLSALQTATHANRPGPVLLVVPIDQGAAQCNIFPILGKFTTIETSIDPNITPHEAVEEVRKHLEHARRPLIVLGAGARRYSNLLERMINTLRVPFVTTPQAKGLISERHPLSLRNGGLASSCWAKEYTQAGVDVALVLGTDLDDCSVGATKYVANDGALFHVDVDTKVFNRNLPTRMGIVCDIGLFAESLMAAANREYRSNHNIEAELFELRKKSAFHMPNFSSDTDSVIAPYRAIADLERAAEGAWFVTDIGEHMLFALHYLTADANQFVIKLGFGSMGSGIASAIGMALGNPKRKVICICGDGGMQMVGMEALVARQWHLPIVFAVFNDSRYNMVYHGYKQVYGREAQWETPPIDFSMWAASFKIPAARIDHPGQITTDLIDSLTTLGPAVLDIRINRDLSMGGGGRNEALSRMSMLGIAQPL